MHGAFKNVKSHANSCSEKYKQAQMHWHNVCWLSVCEEVVGFLDFLLAALPEYRSVIFAYQGNCFKGSITGFLE